MAALDTELQVKPMQYIIERGSQLANASFGDIEWHGLQGR